MLTNDLEQELEAYESDWSMESASTFAARVEQLDGVTRVEMLGELFMIDLELFFRATSDAGELQNRLAEYFRQFPEVPADPQLKQKILAFNDSMRSTLGAKGRATTYDRLGEPTRTHGSRSIIGLQTPCDLNDFKLLRVIGEGGMGVVFEAQQQNPSRRVAIKLLHATLASQDDPRKRFQQEIELIGSIDHPGVVPVFESDEFEGHCYYVMPLLSGGTLRQRIANEELNTRDSAQLFCEIADAVAVAHEHGIVHRDLKPSNVLFGSDGRPRIADFGLSRRTDGSHTLTRTGQFLGTPGYLAPERIAVDAKELDEKSGDIYSLGALLYDMLCGRPPYRGINDWETLSRVLSTPPVAPSRLNPNVDRDLETICLKCLQRSPRSRYATCAELAEDVQRYLRGQPIHARRPGLPERALRYVRQHPARSGLLVASVSLAIITVFSVLVVQRLDLREREVANIEMLRRGEAHLSKMAGAGMQLSSRQTGWRSKTLEMLNEAAVLKFPSRDDSQLRSLVATTVLQRDLLPVAELAKGIWCNTLTFDPTGQFLALGQNKDFNGFRVLIHRVDDWDAKPYTLWIDCTLDNLRRRIQGNGKAEDGARAIQFSPDGRRLAIGTRHGRLHVYSWDGVKAKFLSVHEPVPGKQVDKLSFSPDGEVLWIVTTGKQLRFLQEGSIQQFVPLGDASIQDFAVSPVDDTIFVVLNTDRVQRFEAHDAIVPTWELPFDVDINNVRYVAVSKDGRFLALSIEDGTRLDVVDTVYGHLRASLNSEDVDGSGVAGAPVFGCRDAFLATTSNNRVVSLRDVESRATIASHDVPLRGGTPGIAASPRDPLIAITEHYKVTIYKMTGGNVVESFARAQSPLLDFALDNSGKRIATFGARDHRLMERRNLSYAVWLLENKLPQMTHYQHYYTSYQFPESGKIGFAPDNQNLVTLDHRNSPAIVPGGNVPAGKLDWWKGDSTNWIDAQQLKVVGAIADGTIEDPAASDGQARELTLGGKRSLALSVKLPKRLFDRYQLFNAFVVCRFEGQHRPESVHMKIKSKALIDQVSRLDAKENSYTAIWTGAHLLNKSLSLNVEFTFDQPVDRLLIDGLLISYDRLRELDPDRAYGEDALFTGVQTHRPTNTVWQVNHDEEIRIVDYAALQPLGRWENRSDSYEAGLGTISATLETAPWIVCGTIGGEIFVFDAASFEQLTASTPIESKVCDLQWISDTNQLAVAFESGAVQVLSLPDLEVMQTLTHHRLSVETVCYDETRKCLYAGSDDGTISVWTRSQEQFERYYTADLKLGRIRKLRYSKDHDCLIALIAGETALRKIHLAPIRAAFSQLQIEGIPTTP